MRGADAGIEDMEGICIRKGARRTPKRLEACKGCGFMAYYPELKRI